MISVSTAAKNGKNERSVNITRTLRYGQLPVKDRSSEHEVILEDR